MAALEDTLVIGHEASIALHLLGPCVVGIETGGPPEHFRHSRYRHRPAKGLAIPGAQVRTAGLLADYYETPGITQPIPLAVLPVRLEVEAAIKRRHALKEAPAD